MTNLDPKGPPQLCDTLSSSFCPYQSVFFVPIRSVPKKAFYVQLFSPPCSILQLSIANMPFLSPDAPPHRKQAISFEFTPVISLPPVFVYPFHHENCCHSLSFAPPLRPPDCSPPGRRDADYPLISDLYIPSRILPFSLYSFSDFPPPPPALRTALWRRIQVSLLSTFFEDII